MTPYKLATALPVVTHAQVLAQLRDLIAVCVNSDMEADGVIRDTRAIHEIACLHYAIKLITPLCPSVPSVVNQ